MVSFKKWLENTNIRVTKYNRAGLITFEVEGSRYTYSMDAGYFFNGFFKNWIKYAPGKALNFAKRVGTLVDPLPNISGPPERRTQQSFKFDDA